MTDIIDRTSARAAGLNKYYTGQPCTNGHTAERYVQSGACVGCVTAHVYRSRQQHMDEQTTPRAIARRRFQLETVSVKVRLPLAKLPDMMQMAAALLQSRFPELTGDDRISFTPSPKITDTVAGVATARILAHRDDAATIQALAGCEL